MRLLIVDDENEIREGLKDTVDWKKAGIDEVITAKNGIEAVKVMQKSIPDIVLTDIRMPGMDGLELADFISNTYPKTKIILISGYADFSYAKQAISIGVEEYFIKPVIIDDLLKKAGEIVKSIKLEKSTGNNDNDKRDKTDSFIRRIMANPRPSHIDHSEFFASLGLKWDKPFLSAVLLEIDGNNSWSSTLPVSMDTIREHLENKLSVINATELFSYCGHMEKHLAFFINLKSRDEHSKMLRELPGIFYDVDSLSSKYGFSVTTSVSRLHSRNDFSKAYADSVNTMKNKFFIGKGVVLSSAQFENKIYDLPLSPDSVREELVKAIRLANTEECLSVLQPVFRSYRFSSVEKIELIKEYFLKIVMILSSEVCKLSKAQSEGNILQLGYMQYAEKLETVDEFIAQVERFYCDIIGILKQSQTSKSRWIVEKAKEYMEKNYFNDLTVEEIACHVDRNPNYLCHIFNSIEGVPITEYLNKLRIEKAKELLKTTSLMSYEIAGKVGFKNYRYFSQVFKKYENQTPMSYRNEMLTRVRGHFT